MDHRHLAHLKEQLRPVAEGLRLNGTDIESFRQYLEDFRQRPVLLVPRPMGTEILGLWAATDTADVIFYEEATTPYHQRHIVLHEGGHILQGHTGPPLEALAGGIATHLEPWVIRSLLCRSVFTTQEEAEAEVLATLVEERLDEFPPLHVRRTRTTTVNRIARFARETR